MHFLYMLLLLHIEARMTNADKIKSLSSLDLNPNPPGYDGPVMFDRIGRHGFGDTDYKQPINPLLYEDIDIPSYSDVEKSLDSEIGNIFMKKEEVPVFGSPRDEMLYYKNKEKRDRPVKDPILFDFTSILERNIDKANSDSMYRNHPFFNRSRDSKNKVQVPKFNVSKQFKDNSFYLMSGEKKLNWTTCEEFAKDAKFHPDDIVNTQWLPFYIWSTDYFITANVHRFFYPNKKLVQHYKTVYGPYVRRKLNWKEPKLILKETRELLLIAGDRKGLFYAVPRQELAESIKNTTYSLPVITLRMKIHDPYLALMYCDHRFATIMAEVGTEPKTMLDKKNEAGTLNFRGTGRPAIRDIEFEKNHQALLRRQKEEREKKKFIYGIED